MRLAYFPGCWLTTTTRDFDRSVRAVATKLDIGLEDFPWNCCGDFSVHLTDEMTGRALAAENLAKAEALGLDIVTPCAGCFRYLEETRKRLEEEPGLRDEVNQLIEGTVSGETRCRPLLAALACVLDTVRERTALPLRGLRVACYYGCRLSRPAHLVEGFDPPLDRSMDLLLEAVGADPVPWSHGAECCGAFHSVPRPDIVRTRVALIRAGAEAAGAAVIATSCPWCYRNLSYYQHAPAIPVVHFTQVLGLALGCASSEVDISERWLRRRIAATEKRAPL